jgi:hypothetical protein
MYKVKQSWKSSKPGRYSVVLLSTTVIAATALASGAPALAARPAGPPRVVSHTPGLRLGPNLSILPVAGRRVLAATAKSRELFGVFCNSPSDCWAVGEIKSKTATVNQVLHWTGKKWFTVAVPNQAGLGKGALNELFAVRCTAKASCWAVGDSQKSGHAILDQLLHFNGKKWSVVSAPAPGGTAAEDINSLSDVACTSASSCWAAGDYGLVGMSLEPEVVFNQALHWNGKKWTFVKTPNPAGVNMGDANALASVRCTAPDDCWAAGTAGSVKVAPKLGNEMLHWNGKTWITTLVPSPVLKGKVFINAINTLACTASDNCWGVGLAGKFTGKGFEHNEALHWNGRKWALVKTPNPGGMVNQLFGVTCIAARDCWAVGSAGNQPGLNEAMHWNGAKWSVVHTANGGGTGTETVNTLHSVRCTSHSNCWAVGDADVMNNTTEVNQILQWNGAKWQDS